MKTLVILALAGLAGGCLSASGAQAGVHACRMSFTIASGVGKDEIHISDVDKSKAQYAKMVSEVRTGASQEAVRDASKAAAAADMSHEHCLGNCRLIGPSRSPLTVAQAKPTSSIAGGPLGGLTFYGRAPWKVTGYCAPEVDLGDGVKLGGDHVTPKPKPKPVEGGH